MILSDSNWSTFWSDIWNSLKNSLANLREFWFGSTEQQPYIVNFLAAIAFLILGLLLTRLFLAILRKLFKIDKKLIKDRTIKTFLLSLVKVIANIAIVIIFLLILKVDLTGVAQIFSSAILAVGLSLQDVISNFASGVIILANKPFVVGDYIDLNNGEAEGTVIDVKFLVTALETVDKQIITVPNKNITGSVVKNYSKNPLRRITLNIGVDYSTNIDKAKNVILNIVKNDNRILEEPNPVVFLTAFNDSSLNLSLRCYVPNLMYWDILFSLNEKILLEFRKNDINIPFNRLVVSMTKD